MKYLKVVLEGPHTGDEWTMYEALEEGREYTEEALNLSAQDLISTVYTWGQSVVDEADVPEDERL